MKYILPLLATFAAGLLYLTLSGCSTDQPGTSNTLGTYTTNVRSSPDKVTKAAYKACEDLELTNINSSGTTVDGKVTASTAQGEQITIDIEQSGDGVSKVSIRAGTTGDDSLSKQLVDRINKHLSWF
jgi:uncharacterized protein DUF3568